MDIKQLGIMKNREEAFACFKDLYEYYLYKNSKSKLLYLLKII